MRLSQRLRDAPERLATGAYILHAGVQKWNGTPEHAPGLHAMAAAAFPFLRPIPPQRFRRLLATGESPPALRCSPRWSPPGWTAPP